jgi:hypothetical protein
MRRYCAHSFVFAAALLVAFAMALPAYAQNKNPDSTLFTIYNYGQQPPTEISWLTCGSLPQSEGCYGSGSFQGFTNICSVVQSVPGAINLNTVLRYIYIRDTGSSAGGATLTAYKRTDAVSQTSDTITITMVAVVPLPQLVGGTGVTCYSAQNPDYVYAGTNQSTTAVAINKTNYSVSTAGDIPGTVAAITADSYGYVTIVQLQNGIPGFTTYAPNGEGEEDGGGSYFMINPIDGVNPTNYPLFDSAGLPKLGYWPKLPN